MTHSVPQWIANLKPDSLMLLVIAIELIGLSL